jgi:hypothetical protein
MLLFCGAPEESPKVEAEKPEAGADLYYAALSESELQSFIKAMPAFKEAAAEINKEMESLEGPEAFKAMMGQYSMLNKQMPELDTKLRAAGMSWEEFWPALGKTYIALAAVFMDSMMVQMKEQMKGQPAEAVKEVMKGMEETYDVYEAVPQTNKDLVKKYMADLRRVLEVD